MNDVLKIGSRGDSVFVLQTLLEKGGYNIKIDGIFGSKTEDIIIEFQKDNNLVADGIVGKLTWNKLMLNDNKMINDTKYILPEKNYYKEKKEKKCVVLHHTNGWVVAKGTKDTPSMTHFDWWISQDKKISTALSVDYKGNIYQHFDPEFWAHHLGVGSSFDQTSIGIELTNEGSMEKKENNEFIWFSGKVEIPYNRPNDEPIYVKEGWRGYNWFAPYSKEQVDSTLWLVKYLCDKYKIKKNFIAHCNYDLTILSGKFEGIYNHANVRNYPSDRPKWDLSPAFPFDEFKKKL